MSGSGAGQTVTRRAGFAGHKLPYGVSRPGTARICALEVAFTQRLINEYSVRIPRSRVRPGGRANNENPMSDAVADEAPETEEEGEAQEESPPPKRKLLSGKRIVIGLGGIVVLAVGAYMSGMLDSVVAGFLGGEGGDGEVVSNREPIYFDMPEMLVNLSTSDNRQSYLKITISFELEDKAAISELRKVMPRIVDNFQTYLRELRPEDLSGSAGVYRLKEELLTRANTAVHPIVIYDVLFAEMLIQ